MGIYQGEGSPGEVTIRRQVLAERIRSTPNVRPQLPERTGASDSGGVQHPGRHLKAAQAGIRRSDPNDLDGPEFLGAVFRGVLPTSHALSFKSLKAMLGNIPLKEFQRKDLHRYVAQTKKLVKSATVSRAIAAISKKVALRAARRVHMGQANPCAQMRYFDVHGHVYLNCCPRVSYGSPRGFTVPVGEIGSGRERPPFLPPGSALWGEADVH